MHINSSLLDLLRVQFLRENTLLRVSPLFLLNHFLGFLVLLDLELLFEAELEDPTTRGYLVVVELSFG